MANKNHVVIVRSGVSAIRHWRSEHPYAVFDLSEADLGAADLAGLNLSGADLSKANLRLADLSGADLGEQEEYTGGRVVRQSTRLVRADLREALLVGSDMVRADLRAASLHHADLRGANLTGAKLAGAILMNVIYDDTTVWPKGFRPGLFVVKRMVVALDADMPEIVTNSGNSDIDRASFSKAHLAQQKSELQGKYDTVSKRIAALDTDLGRALDSLSRQVLEEQRKEFAAQREEIAAQMARIEKQLGK